MWECVRWQVSFVKGKGVLGASAGYCEKAAKAPKTSCEG